MSTHKTVISQDAADAFLAKHFSEPVTDLTYIEGGESSQAFSFDKSGDKLILRVNKNTQSFEKDRYAHEFFASENVPIPAVLEIGAFDETYHYAISERVPGKKMDALSESEKSVTLPRLFEVLDAIHESNVSATKGYGKWLDEGEAEHGTWHEYLYSIYGWVIDEEKPSLFETTILEEEVWRKVFEEICSLIQYCPQERHLLHGDYGFDNVFSDGNHITGVIDWGESSYGDVLYDGAWLSYWSKEHSYRDAVKKHYAGKDVLMKNFDTRMRCYELHTGLAALTFYALSHQEKKYKWNKERLLSVLRDNYL